MPGASGEEVRAGVRELPHQLQRLGAVERVLLQGKLVHRYPDAVLPLPYRQRRRRLDVAGASGGPGTQGRCPVGMHRLD